MNIIIAQALERFSNFSEWIIEAIELQKFGTTIRMELYSPIDASGKSISNEDNYLRCVLLFEGVQEFQIQNHLNNALITNLNEINWGFNEIAAFKIVDKSEIAEKYHNSNVPLTEYVFLWESQRQIRIISTSLVIEQVG
ncbi:MAG: hypothetical protein KF713_11250 [Turneriella sp.]|nr:hypothetical protein [Turneriella sp.]